MKIQTAAVCALSMFAAACGSTASAPHYYQLPDSTFRLPESSRSALAVQVELAEPLQGQSLVYQDGEYSVSFARQNLWAAPLQDMLAAALANKLNRQSGSVYLPHRTGENGPTVKVYIDRFQGNYRGETEINGYVRLPDGSRKGFRQISPQQGDGYDAMVRSLNQGLDGVAAQLAH